MSYPRVRIAGPDDCEQLAELAANSFIDAFAADNNPDDMRDYVHQAFSAEVLGTELQQSNNTFLVATLEDGKLVGYAKLREGIVHPSVSGPNPLELERLYVDSSAIGTGVGAKLIERVLNEARTHGADTVWLGVWENNDRAISFYRKWGFEETGSHVFKLGSDEQTDIIMSRPVPPTRETA